MLDGDLVEAERSGTKRDRRAAAQREKSGAMKRDQDVLFDLTR